MSEEKLEKHQILLQKIDSNFVKELKDAIDAAQVQGRQLELRIDCPGGCVRTGLKIIDLIKASPVNVEGHVIGSATSMAAFILQTCHTRVMDTNTYLRFHYACWMVSFRMYFEPKMRRLNWANGIALQEKLIAHTKSRTRMSKARIHQLLREDRQLDPEEAFKLRLIDEIRQQ